MIEIKEVTNKNEAISLIEKYRLSVAECGTVIMAVKDREDILGVIAGSIDGESGYIFDAETEDNLLLHGMGKALLNLFDLRGVKQVDGKNNKLTSLYKMLGFSEKNNQWKLSLTGYFDTNCKKR